jgi:phosphohistidine swiveling domain-containing protein
LPGVDDAFYLTFDELFSPPSDAAETVGRRRRDRSRLSALRMPAVFSGTWAPEEQATVRALPGERIEGAGASPGRAKGTVRIVTAETAHELEPGEVLVARVTDVGYTPVFANAAAVVTDVGGIMSHAAVVAREFAIPAVTDTATATARLGDGMLVEIDGTAGTVTVLEG